MAVPTQLSDLSATAASNSPAGTDTVGTTMDDFIRAHASIIARISAGTDALATPALGAPTAAGRISANLGLTVAGGTLVSRGLTDSATATALTLSGSGANSVTIANSATNPTIGTSAGNLLFTPAGLQTLVLIAPASAVNYVSIVSQVTGNGPSINATGLDADVPLYLTSKGSQSIFLSTNGGATAQVAILDTASATRYITLTGSNGGNPTIGTSGGGLAVSADLVGAGFLQAKAATATPAGGTPAIYIGASAHSIGFGSGIPTYSALKGSLYLRSDGSTTNNRMYVNTDGAATWTAVTTAA